LESWEQKLLGQQYEKDPLDKRIQRLELLLFGSTQDGSYSERLEQIRQTIASRSSLKMNRSTSADSLGQIEQRVLKHKFASETSEQRLSRLESKIFGKPSPAMSTTDRIERLNRTLGIGDTPPIAQGASPADPLGMLGSPGMMRQFHGMTVIPFGDQSPNGDDINKQMMEMMRRMNSFSQQMGRMHGDQLGPSTPFPDMAPPGRKIAPGQGLHMTKPNDKEQKLPPYLDPNAI
jgi:hypothetical protein